MNRPEIVLIVARATNGVIGIDGRLPWHIPADLRRFKQLTMGTPMIMGRRKFDALPSLLADRRHIVMTTSPRDSDTEVDGVEWAFSLEGALSLANAPRVSIIGGLRIFELFLPIADRVELTEVHSSPQGDTLMAKFPKSEWKRTLVDSHPAEEGRPSFNFVTLTRNR